MSIYTYFKSKAHLEWEIEMLKAQIEQERIKREIQSSVLDRLERLNKRAESMVSTQTN